MKRRTMLATAILRWIVALPAHANPSKSNGPSLFSQTKPSARGVVPVAQRYQRERRPSCRRIDDLCPACLSWPTALPRMRAG